MIELGIGQPPRRPEIRSDATSLGDQPAHGRGGHVDGEDLGRRRGGSRRPDFGRGHCPRQPCRTAYLWGRAGWLRQAAPWPRTGQACYLLEAPGGRVRLLRATITDVWGDGPDPADWYYRLTIAGPRTTNTVTAPAASVVHIRYATEAHSPARGVSPLQYAALDRHLDGEP